jgi:hypothetical protein
MLLAAVLLIGFLVVSFVNQASTHGFFPRLPAAADKHGFSPANFLYSFIPAVLGLLLFLLWQPLDYTHRRLAPFKALSSPDGATAYHSLLLDYPASLPLSTTVTALSNGHYLIALTSILTVFSTALPVLAGGAFWAQWYPSTSTVRVAAHPAGLYAICVFASIYAFGFVALLVAGRAVALPHQATCLADLVSWLYQSPILTDRAFSRVGGKADLVARLVSPGMASQYRLGFWNSVLSLSGRKSPPVHGARGKAVQRLSTVQEIGTPYGGSRTVRMVGSNESFPQHPAVGHEHAFAAARDGDEHRYGFGVFIGRDGREHLGIDRLGRRGREMVVL